MPRFLLFTDLDGTLLSHADYDWRPAVPTLDELRRRTIPVVIATSKTRAEIEAWRRRLGINDPFISENGGALYVPRATALEVEGAVRDGNYLKVEFGTPYRELRRALAEIAQATGTRLRGFGDLSHEEITSLTGLSGEDLDLATQREYDEPFLIDDDRSGAVRARIEFEASSRGLLVVRGGRFDHLLGPNSKGQAARRLAAAYVARGGPLVTIALGDGPNDVELLAFADRPVVVARPDGSHTPELRAAVPRALFTRAPGPKGFAEGVGAVLHGVESGGGSYFRRSTRKPPKPASGS